MGKKIELKRIEDCKRSQITFSKRRSSIIKKMQEISINCDVNVAFLAFSSAGRISKFCNLQRIEDVLEHYVNLPVEKRLSHIDNIQEKIKRLEELGNISSEEGYFSRLNDQIKSLELRVKESEKEVEQVEAALGDFEIRSEEEVTLDQLSRCETNLKQVIQKVNQIKQEKLAMEKEKEMQRLANEGVSRNRLPTGFMFPNNVFDEMLGNNKGIAKENPVRLTAGQIKAHQDQVAASKSYWTRDINFKKDNLVTRDFLSAFPEISKGVDVADDEDDGDAINYMKDLSVTKKGSKSGDVNINFDINVEEGTNNNVNTNENSEVMILSPPPSAAPTDFFSLK